MTTQTFYEAVSLNSKIEETKNKIEEINYYESRVRLRNDSVTHLYIDSYDRYKDEKIEENPFSVPKELLEKLLKNHKEDLEKQLGNLKSKFNNL